VAATSDSGDPGARAARGDARHHPAVPYVSEIYIAALKALRITTARQPVGSGDTGQIAR